MVEIEVEAVRALQFVVDDASLSVSQRSLEVRRFCNEHRASAPVRDRLPEYEHLWTIVDTEHLLEISADMAPLSNYLLERVIAAS